MALSGGIAIGAMIGVGAGFMMAWAGGDARQIVAAAAMAAGAWALGGAVGLGLIIAATVQDAAKLSFAVLAASMLRMMVALAVGLTSFFAFSPDGRTFWTTFLVCGLTALIAETSWTLFTLKHGQASGRPDGAV